MGGWTRLHDKTNLSLKVADLIDQEPEAFVLFTLMIAKAGVWGRFPGHPKRLKAVVAPLVDRLTAARIQELLLILEAEPYRFVTQYEVEGESYLYNTGHFDNNPMTAWHRVGPPDYPHPLDFVPPPGLIEYMRRVHEGKLPTKDFVTECVRLQLDSMTMIRSIEQKSMTGSGTCGADSQHQQGTLDNDSVPLPSMCAPGATTTQRPDPTDSDSDSDSDVKDSPVSHREHPADCCLDLYGLTYHDLDVKQAATYYKAMSALLSQMDGGTKELQAWAKQASRPRTLGNGAKPEKAIPAAVRREITAKEWENAFAGERGGTLGPGPVTAETLREEVKRLGTNVLKGSEC